MTTLTPPRPSQPLSLFERLGGEGAIECAVSLFYDKVKADPVTAPFFERMDMRAQVRKLIGFMTHAFGGQAAYTGRDLRTAHKLLVKRDGLSDVHFDAVARHLQATLEELDIPRDLIAECIALVATLRDEVLDR
jgi:hemoglobin